MMKRSYLSFSLSVFLSFGILFSAFSQTDIENWSQFRGHQRAGFSSEKISQPKPVAESVWKTKIGQGFTEILSSDNAIYTMFSEKTDSVTGNEYIAAYEKSTGKELWRTEVDSLFCDSDGWGDGPRSTPVLDSQNIYCLSALGKLSAHDLKSGKKIWQIDFRKEFESPKPRFGFSCSPLLIGDKILIGTNGKEGKSFAAINKKDGKVAWMKGAKGSGYNSPVLVSIKGQQQIIFVSKNIMVAYNAEGDSLWSHKMSVSSVTATPIFIAPNKLFVSSVHAKGFSLIQVNDNKAKEIQKGTSMKNDFSTCVYHNGHIYGFHVAALRCISAETGKVKWTKRGFGRGSLILVDGKLIVLSDKGKLAIAEATPEKYSQLSITQAINGKSWTAPSFHNGAIYVRNLSEMACLKIK